VKRKSGSLSPPPRISLQLNPGYLLTCRIMSPSKRSPNERRYIQDLPMQQ
jgi:hypothetical protein